MRTGRSREWVDAGDANDVTVQQPLGAATLLIWTIEGSDALPPNWCVPLIYIS